jgi:SAM-dependent methyltransferase
MISKGDDGNTVLATSRQFVDSLNAEFYSKLQYPWAPMVLDRYTDPHFELALLNQSVGDWKGEYLPPDPTIWVAGCGTNQAAITALRFPTGRVLGSDLSPKSLEACANTARQVGATNLALKRESISEVGYTAQFDHIKCTGVIHHNADPEVPLARLAAALKPNGVMELMVYNRYHRLIVSAAQKAVRILEDIQDKPDFLAELDIAKKMAAEGVIRRAAGQTTDYLDRNDSHLADALIQPVEYGYTVESLEAMAERAGLEILAPCINQFDQARGTYDWNLEFQDPDLRRRYEALPDTRRWQVTNLLRLEDSPMLWFYLQHKGAARPRVSEPDLCEAFLGRVFRPAQTEREIYVKRKERYERAPARQPFPGPPPDALHRSIVERVASGERRPMRTILSELDQDLSFATVNRLRIQLTTVAFPYLRAIGP